MKTEITLPGLLRIKPVHWVAIFLLLHVFTLRSQRIQNIALSSAGGVVRVDFSVIKGSNCQGYNILHSTDSVFFTLVGEYSGICSSPTEDVPHSYNHTSPQPNAVNYYKIELTFVETSDIQRIYVSADGRPLLTPYPNPVLLSDGIINFRTSNTENGQLEGFICDESGHKLSNLLVNCYDYTIQVPIYYLSQGIYFVWLSDGVLVYGTKFIVSP
jgi:hypothetical protein